MTGGTIITMDPERRIIEDGEILIEDDTIVSVGEKGAAVAPGQVGEVNVIDAKDKYVFPGLVNTHTHLFQGLLKGLGDDRVLVDWFREVTGPSACYLTPDDCYDAAMLGCLESIKSGATTLVDFMYPHARPGLSDGIIRAFSESGIRGIFGRGYIDYGEQYGVPRTIIEKYQDVLNDCERLFDEFEGSSNGRIHVWAAPCMIWTQSEEGLRAVRDLANRKGMRITMHVAETPFEVRNALERFGKKDLEYLESIDFLGPDVLAVHCVHLDDRDLRILKAYDVKVSHNSVSNMYLSSGVAPIPRMLASGICVGLATDGPASNNNQNMISTLKFTALLHKVDRLDPTVVTAERVLEMATIDGARAVGLDSEIGSIEPGKKADLIICDFENPYAGPVHHPVSTLVYAAVGTEVDTVIIDGRLVMRNGKVLTMDEEHVLQRATKSARDLSARAGTQRFAKRGWRSTGW